MNIIRSARRWFAMRRTLAALDSLPNETLDDIGIDRHELRAVVSRLQR